MPNIEVWIKGIADSCSQIETQGDSKPPGLQCARSDWLISEVARSEAAEELLRERDAQLVRELVGERPSNKQPTQSNDPAWGIMASNFVLDMQTTSSERDHAYDEVQQLTQSLAESSAKVRSLRAEFAASEEQREELLHSFKCAEAERDQLAETVAADHVKISSQRAELSRISLQLESQQHELAIVNGQLKSKREQAAQLLKQKHVLETESLRFWKYHGVGDLQQLKTIARLEVTIAKLNQQFESTKTKLGEQQGGIPHLQSQVESLEQEIANVDHSRRQLNNEIQDLKGSIRVCCRVRPAREGCETVLCSVGVNKLVMNGEKLPFILDRVFDASSEQADIFAEVDGLVQSALDGYKVCIFSYGQTGSGKTYTMLGKKDPDSRGLIPRSLAKILQVSRDTRNKGWHWSLQVSFMEVYNEGLRDLLRNGGSGDAAGGPATGHTILHDDAWGTVVTNMTCIEVASIEQTRVLMERAMKQRAFGITDMNAVSSRSHSIFAIYLKGINRQLNLELNGALHLVDLAGSERLDKSGSTGDRLKETQNINRSLSSLVDVFVAKAGGHAHIPFRNSKLTHLMEPCLSGHGKTLMLVHVGPEQSNTHETLCALRFAKQVSQCDTGGKPKRHVKAAGPVKASTTMIPPVKKCCKGAAGNDHQLNVRSFMRNSLA